MHVIAPGEPEQEEKKKVSATDRAAGRELVPEVV